MCHPISPSVQEQIGCAAKALAGEQRQQLAVRALAAAHSITRLADDHQVSRKFVYQQTAKAQEALDEAFAPSSSDNEALFHIPVTKAWLRQLVLGLTLTCHSSFRGVIELLRDLFDYPISLGTIFNILQDAVGKARQHNAKQDLSAIRIGAHDEIFQAGRPVLVGVDVDSTYCYLLSVEEQRDAETWGIRLLEAQDQGFNPQATIGDGGSGLRAGQALAMPQTPCRGDVFHALQEVESLAGYLQNRAYEAINARHKLQHKQAHNERCKGRRDPALAQDLRHAREAETKAVALADDVALLAQWLRQDILSVTGPNYDDRCNLYDFIVAELRAREHLCKQRIGKLCKTLENQRGDLLAFAVQLDHDLDNLAAEFEVPHALVRELLNLQAIHPKNPRRWQKEAELRDKLRGRFYFLSEAVEQVAAQTVRASSIVENINSRLRGYFFLRRHLGPDYLALLQFFLNHRRFMRSERPERAGKSPAELLNGQPHSHWLELLGYQRFSRN